MKCSTDLPITSTSSANNTANIIISIPDEIGTYILSFLKVQEIPTNFLVSKAWSSWINGLKTNRIFILNLIEQQASAFCLAPNELKNDPIFLLEAVKRNGFVLKYIPAQLQIEEIIEAAYQQNPDVIPLIADAQLREEFIKRKAIPQCVGGNIMEAMRQGAFPANSFPRHN